MSEDLQLVVTFLVLVGVLLALHWRRTPFGNRRFNAKDRRSYVERRRSRYPIDHPGRRKMTRRDMRERRRRVS